MQLHGKIEQRHSDHNSPTVQLPEVHEQWQRQRPGKEQHEPENIDNGQPRREEAKEQGKSNKLLTDFRQVSCSCTLLPTLQRIVQILNTVHE